MKEWNPGGIPCCKACEGEETGRPLAQAVGAFPCAGAARPALPVAVPVGGTGAVAVPARERLPELSPVSSFPAVAATRASSDLAQLPPDLAEDPWSGGYRGPGGEVPSGFRSPSDSRISPLLLTQPGGQAEPAEPDAGDRRPGTGLAAPAGDAASLPSLPAVGVAPEAVMPSVGQPGASLGPRRRDKVLPGIADIAESVEKKARAVAVTPTDNVMVPT